ncbi:hypothetical protein KC926_01935 [Candidatus Kaiserbacteria bacterium]|nr:hypothetical protein [Candidatus Kaiserbacteria bacterium]
MFGFGERPKVEKRGDLTAGEKAWQGQVNSGAEESSTASDEGIDPVGLSQGYQGFNHGGVENNVSEVDGKRVADVEPSIERVLELDKLNSLLQAAQESLARGDEGAKEQVEVIEGMLAEHHEHYGTNAE